MNNYGLLSAPIILISFFVTLLFMGPFTKLLQTLKFGKREGGLGTKGKSLVDTLHDFKSGTPIGGGILILFVVTTLFLLIYMIFKYLNINISTAYSITDELWVVFLTLFGFACLGFVDDWVKIRGKETSGVYGSWIGISRRSKLVIQAVLSVTVGFLLYFKLGIDSLYIPLVDENIFLGPFYIPFSAFVIIYYSNAFNFTDGLDGLASGLLLILLVAYIFIAITVIDIPLFLFMTLLLGSTMAFLLFNIYPASIFLGDTGSLAFGAVVAVVGLLMGNIIALFVIGGVFFVEAASSLIQILWWILFKKKFFPIAPIHHTFLLIGWEEPKIVMRAWIIGIILAIFGLWLAII